jgi:hypothetical protein
VPPLRPGVHRLPCLPGEQATMKAKYGALLFFVGLILGVLLGLGWL